MSFKIVIGVNGDDGGSDAIALARRLAPPASELIAVTVAVLDGHPSRAVSLDYDARIRHDALTLIADVRSENPDLQGEVQEAPAVGAGLHAVCERLEADLVVVGSCRRGIIGRILAGDDVRETLRGAPVAVAVAPRDFAVSDQPIATIGLGWDNGPEADEALAFARRLAEGTGAGIHAVSVVAVPPWDSSPLTGQPALADAVEQATELLAALGDVEGTTVTGQTSAELTAFAAEVDVLVVGSHQRGPLGRIAMGSASEHLARNATRPLVVVPRAAQPVITPV